MARTLALRGGHEGTQVALAGAMWRRTIAVGFLAGALLAGCELGPPAPPSAQSVCANGTLAQCQATCSAGDSEGCAAFGTRICKEGSVPECEAACDGGNDTACGALAEIYWLGHRVPNSEARYYALKDRLCMHGSEAACRELAKHYDNDWEGTNGRKRAIVYYRELCVGKTLFRTSDEIQKICEKRLESETTGSSRHFMSRCSSDMAHKDYQIEEDCTNLAAMDRDELKVFVDACHNGRIGACGRLTEYLHARVDEEFPGEYADALGRLCRKAQSDGNHDADFCGRLKDLGFAKPVLR